MSRNFVPRSEDLKVLNRRINARATLPSVYDDALSYQNLIYKLMQYLEDGLANIEDWNVWLDGFVSTFDTKLQDTVRETIQALYDSGKLAELTADVIAVVQDQIDDVDSKIDDQIDGVNSRVDTEIGVMHDQIGTVETKQDEMDNRFSTHLEQMPQVNVKHFGAVGDGVTNDTQAVKEAIAYACSFAERIEGSGYLSKPPNILFPAGEYIISEPQALNPTVSVLRGFNIVGEGYMNTFIRYTYDGDGEDDYLMLNGGKSWWAYSYVENISFIGNNDNNIWAVKSQAGAPQACRFNRVQFNNVNNAVTVLYGTDNYNADLFLFEGCKANRVYGWVFGVPGTANSQSVVHSFVNCDFETIYGTILHFKSGGEVTVFGGSWIVNTDGRVITCDDHVTSDGIGAGNKYFTFIGTKFEWQGSSNRRNDETFPLSYSNSAASIKFMRCNFFQFASARPTPHIFSKLEKGELIFDDCNIPSSMRVNLGKPDSANLRHNVPYLLVINSHINTELADFAVVETYNNNVNIGWRPIVEAINCRRNEGNDLAPVDVSLNRQNRGKGLTTNKKIFKYHHGTDYRLGLPNTKQTLKLPIGSTLTKIYLMATSGTDTRTFKYTIKNFDETKILLTAEFALTPTDEAFISEDLYLHLPTDEERKIVIDVETTAASGRHGYIDFEYI